MITDLAIANEGAFVLAEEETVSLRHQFFLRLVDKDIGTREAHIHSVGRNTFIRAPLHTRKRQAPAEAQGAVAATTIVTETQGRLMSSHPWRQFQVDPVFGRARVECWLERFTQAFDGARTFGEGNAVRGNAAFVGALHHAAEE